MNQKNKYDTSCWVVGNPEYVKQVLKQKEQLKERLSKGIIEGALLDLIALYVSNRGR